MIEIISTLVILAILAAILIPPFIGHINSANEQKMNNIARTIFLSAQTGLTDLRNRGQLSELATFDSGTLTGGYLKTDIKSKHDQVPSDLLPPTDTSNHPYIYYIVIPAGTPDSDGNFMKNLLYDSLADKDVLEYSIVIEFNAKTGVVFSAFYSETHKDFSYSGTGETNLSVAENRVPSHKLGYYGVDYTGALSDIPEGLAIDLIDGFYDPALPANALQNALFVRASMPVDEINDPQYEITLNNSNNIQITDGTNKTAITFKLSDISEISLSGALLNNYDSNGKSHIVYKEEVTAHGQDYAIIYWILDYVDYSVNSASGFKYSIGVHYPEIPVDDITAVISETGLVSRTATSISRHSYYLAESKAGAVDASYSNAYIVGAPRHLNNVRFVATNAAAPLNRFTQTVDIDLFTIDYLSPLSWKPVFDGTNYSFDTSAPFVGKYISASGAGIPMKIQNLSMTNSLDSNTPFGLLGTVGAAGAIDGIMLDAVDIESNYAGSVGAIAGESAGVINRCIVYGVVDVSCSGSSNVGGIVGKMTGGILSKSYNAGYYKAGDILTANTGFIAAVIPSGKANIGGLAGAVDAGAVIENCYNNARVNIRSVEIEDFESYKPISLAMGGRTTFTDLSLGGLVGESAGTVRTSYATNFVGSYSGSATNRSMTAALIGNNSGTCVNCLAIRNNAKRAVGGAVPTGGRMITKAKLKSAVTDGVFSSSIFENGNIAAVLPAADSYLPENYPYPVLKTFGSGGEKGHFTEWEDIQITVPDLLTVTAQNNLLDAYGNRYKLVVLETAESFYDYVSNDMDITIEWADADYKIDNSNPYIPADEINGNANRKVEFTIEPGGRYEIMFYNNPTNSSRTAAVKVTGFVPAPLDNPLDLLDYTEIFNE